MRERFRKFPRAVSGQSFFFVPPRVRWEYPDDPIGDCKALLVEDRKTRRVYQVVIERGMPIVHRVGPVYVQETVQQHQGRL